MGHIIAKDAYRRLGAALDGSTVRMPWSESLNDLLRSLYTPEEADLVARMPRRPSPIERVAAVTGEDAARLRPRLEAMCAKGLVCDLWEDGRYLYMASPFVIGFFEFTMMRTRGELDHDQWADLFHRYMFGDTAFLDANFGHGEQVSIMRALPHDGTLRDVEHVEILDYEKASALVDAQDVFAVGLCSCRHEREHLEGRDCAAPLETCTSMGDGARFLMRNGFAREIDRAEMLDILDRSRDLGLTLTTDNVRRDAGFVCHCCGCCCNLMRGIRYSGHAEVVVSSSFIARCEADACTGCGLCAKACPIDAVAMVPGPEREGKRPRPVARVDAELCLGCGVCALKCPTSAMALDKREQKVFHPEDSFERAITQSLERGTLQNLLFDDPGSRAQGFMRAMLGGFLRLSPVKKALMSEALRSRFLDALRRGGA